MFDIVQKIRKEKSGNEMRNRDKMANAQTEVNNGKGERTNRAADEKRHAVGCRASFDS